MNVLRHVQSLLAAAPAALGSTSDELGHLTGRPQNVELRLVQPVRVTAGTKGFGPCALMGLRVDPRLHQAFLEFVAAAGYQYVDDAQLKAMGLPQDGIRQMHKSGALLHRRETIYRADPMCPDGGVGYDIGRLAAELVKPRLPGTDVVFDEPSDLTDPPEVSADDPVAYFDKALSLEQATLKRYFITNPAKRLDEAAQYLEKLSGGKQPIDLDERAQARFVWFRAKVAKHSLQMQYNILTQLPDLSVSRSHILDSLHSQRP